MDVDKTPYTMNYILSLLFCTLFLLPALAQNDDEGGVALDMKRFSENWFDDLDEAKQQPDKVWYLDLSLEKRKIFPNEILEFNNLQELHLANNYWPEIPAKISKLKQLTYIDLSSSYYLRSLPVAALAKLPNLETLVLKDFERGVLPQSEIDKAKQELEAQGVEVITD